MAAPVKRGRRPWWVSEILLMRPCRDAREWLIMHQYIEPRQVLMAARPAWVAWLLVNLGLIRLLAADRMETNIEIAARVMDRPVKILFALRRHREARLYRAARRRRRLRGR